MTDPLEEVNCVIIVEYWLQKDAESVFKHTLNRQYTFTTTVMFHLGSLYCFFLSVSLNTVQSVFLMHSRQPPLFIFLSPPLILKSALICVPFAL